MKSRGRSGEGVEVREVVCQPHKMRSGNYFSAVPSGVGE